jgi:CheY-like chemotaxis protein
MCWRILCYCTAAARGAAFPAEYWSHPILWNDEVIGAVVTFLDVTERRKAEQEIQEGVRRREQFLIGRLRPDLALVDLGLPVMSGFDLARRIRQNPGNARTRLVALSEYGWDSDIQASLVAGFDEHLTKPLNRDQLGRLLRG